MTHVTMEMIQTSRLQTVEIPAVGVVPEGGKMVITNI